MEKLPIIICEFINIVLKFDTAYADIYIDLVCHLVYNIVILYKNTSVKQFYNSALV